MMKRICVFCGSNLGAGDAYRTAATQLGAALVRHDLGLVFGGGRVGLMGVLADAVLAAGGDVIGVIPQALVARELAHRRVSKMHVVGSMHERKALMADLSDGFIALPGGYGTLEEFCEMVTWSQLGLHCKPCGLLNVAGFFDSLLALFEHAIAERFIVEAHRNLLVIDRDAEGLLGRMLSYEPPRVEKWLDRDET
jgi:uncharacterized protein (TIGR00730 family)